MIPLICPFLGAREQQAVVDLLSRRLAEPEGVVREFEAAFAEFLGGGHALATNSGFAALHLALGEFHPSISSLWIPDYASPAAVTAADHAGFLYRLLDCRPNSFLAAGERDDGRNLRVGTHLFGQADLDLLKRRADTLIEEVGDGPGAWLGGQPAGTYGLCGAFAFDYAGAGSALRGGLLFSRDPALIQEARDRADFDYKNSYRPRHAYRMSPLEAAVGLAQMQGIVEQIAARRELAERYLERLSACLPASALPPHPRQAQADGRPTHVYTRFCLRLVQPVEPVVEALRAAGVEAARPIYLPAHRLLKQNPADFPHAEAVYQGALALPFYPSLQPPQVEALLDAVCRALEGAERGREALPRNGPAQAP